MAVDDSLFMKDVNFDGALTMLFKEFKAAKRVQKKVQEGPEPEHEKLLKDVVESTARERSLEQNAPDLLPPNAALAMTLYSNVRNILWIILPLNASATIMTMRWNLLQLIPPETSRWERAPLDNSGMRRRRRLLCDRHRHTRRLRRHRAPRTTTTSP